LKDLDPATLVGVICILLLSLSWHEAAHAWVADRLGDPTARSRGRVTLNPLKHLDPFLSVLLPLVMYWVTGFAFGGGKPVPINVMNFKNRARDFMLVALAGPGSNLLLALLFSVVYLVCASTGVIPSYSLPNPYGGVDVLPPTMLAPDTSSLLEVLLTQAVLLNLLLATFNLIPLPPLDGSRVVGWLLPRGLQRYWYSLDRFGILLVLGMVFFLHGKHGDLLVNGVLSVYDALANQVDSLVMKFVT
jgi:Zn-dependent protease